jgi:hypothetical protein
MSLPLPTCLTLALAVASMLSTAGCRRVKDVPATSRSAVGWSTDFPGEPVRGGRLLTTPPGHEEKILSEIATAVRAWAKGCPRPRSSSRTSVSFRLGLSAEGSLHGIDGAGDDPFAKCLIGKARGQAAIGARPGIDLTVDLAVDVDGRT